MSKWVKDLFGREKPVIAMAHLYALPGTPLYTKEKDLEANIEHVRQEVRLLEEYGVDAILFCNEDDRPYVFEAGLEQITAMTRVVTEARPKSIPFGVDFLWDPIAAMAIAAGTGASFIREVLTGTYESDMGLWSPNAGKVIRFRHQADADHIRVFYNVVPEFASSLGTRSMAKRARSVIVSCLADVILVSGPMAGMEPDFEAVREIKDELQDGLVFLNTGAKSANIAQYLQVLDGVIVGSSLKVDGYTWNPVDPKRVEKFMEQANLGRGLS